MTSVPAQFDESTTAKVDKKPIDESAEDKKPIGESEEDSKPIDESEEDKKPVEESAEDKKPVEDSEEKEKPLPTVIPASEIEKESKPEDEKKTEADFAAPTEQPEATTPAQIADTAEKEVDDKLATTSAPVSGEDELKPADEKKRTETAQIPDAEIPASTDEPESSTELPTVDLDKKPEEDSTKGTEAPESDKVPEVPTSASTENEIEESDKFTTVAPPKISASDETEPTAEEDLVPATFEPIESEFEVSTKKPAVQGPPLPTLAPAQPEKKPVDAETSTEADISTEPSAEVEKEASGETSESDNEIDAGASSTPVPVSADEDKTQALRRLSRPTTSSPLLRHLLVMKRSPTCPSYHKISLKRKRLLRLPPQLHQRTTVSRSQSKLKRNRSKMDKSLLRTKPLHLLHLKMRLSLNLTVQLLLLLLRKNLPNHPLVLLLRMNLPNHPLMLLSLMRARKRLSPKCPQLLHLLVRRFQQAVSLPMRNQLPLLLLLPSLMKM